MSKSRTNAAPKPAASVATAEVHGDGSGQALPEAATPPTDVVNEPLAPDVADAPGIDAVLVPVATLEASPVPPQDERVNALVLCDGSLDGETRYRAGTVVLGIPVRLVDANKHWLDAAPAAVDHAELSGAQAFEYED